jgi:hypothetical protein
MENLPAGKKQFYNSCLHFMICKEFAETRYWYVDYTKKVGEEATQLF